VGLPLDIQTDLFRQPRPPRLPPAQDSTDLRLAGTQGFRDPLLTYSLRLAGICGALEPPFKRCLNHALSISQSIYTYKGLRNSRMAVATDMPGETLRARRLGRALFASVLVESIVKGRAWPALLDGEVD
jgi:hypothetical protein